MTERDYVALFEYFIGARGEHAVHIRALIHAGFVVAPDPEHANKSYVHNPLDDSILGVILGEPQAVIGRFTPEPPAPEPPAPKPEQKTTPTVPEKKAGHYTHKGTGW